jgi:hypothetical protein
MAKPDSTSASLTTSAMNIRQGPSHDRYATQTSAASPDAVMAEGKRYLPSPDSTKSGMVCNSPVSMGPVKKVDQGQSDRKGDVCKATMDQIANTGGPREQMSGQRNSRYYDESGKPFKSTSNSPDSDGGN